MNDNERIPTAETYNLTLKNGKQVSITDVTNKVLKNFAHKALRKLRFQILRINKIRDELERREYDGILHKIYAYREYNIFQMMTHATILATNQHNNLKQEACDHLNYSMTMTGAVCNDCGKEEEE
jgi:hypothetical protein